MRKVVVLFTMVLASTYMLAQEQPSDEYDIYTPMIYHPRVYSDLGPYQPVPIAHFKENIYDCDLRNLETFIRMSNACDIDKYQFSGVFKDYVDLAAKMRAKGKGGGTDLSNKRQMRYFQHDCNRLQYWKYQQDSIKKVEEKVKWDRDYAAARSRFVRDSLECRDYFVADSLRYRKEFLSDSLYRVEFRKKNNYDYVEFDGPHGQPICCYRHGKLVDGELYDSNGRLEKVYSNGKLIHNYSYSKESSGLFYQNDVMVIQDSVEGKRYYQNGDVVEKEEILNEHGDVVERKQYSKSGEVLEKVETFNEYGVVKNCVKYDSAGNLDYEESTIFYPDNKTPKRTERKYAKGIDDLVAFEYFTDGELKQCSYYRKVAKWDYRCIKKVKFDGSAFSTVEYYDYDGKLERTETKYCGLDSDALAAFALTMLLL